jgi:hypothetical protein
MRIFLRTLMLASLAVGLCVAAPRASARPAAATAGPPMSIAVTPNPMTQNTAAYVSVLTNPGAACSASVIYSTGQVPTAFQTTYYNKSYVAASNGVVAWPWQQNVNAKGGWALAICTAHGQLSSASYFFAITSK